jgi:hypothetical protein
VSIGSSTPPNLARDPAGAHFAQIKNGIEKKHQNSEVYKIRRSAEERQGVKKEESGFFGYSGQGE